VPKMLQKSTGAVVYRAGPLWVATLLGLDGIVGPVCTAGASQILDPWLASRGEQGQGWGG